MTKRQRHEGNRFPRNSASVLFFISRSVLEFCCSLLSPFPEDSQQFIRFQVWFRKVFFPPILSYCQLIKMHFLGEEIGLSVSVTVHVDTS